MIDSDVLLKSLGGVAHAPAVRARVARRRGGGRSLGLGLRLRQTPFGGDDAADGGLNANKTLNKIAKPKTQVSYLRTGLTAPLVAGLEAAPSSVVIVLSNSLLSSCPVSAEAAFAPAASRLIFFASMRHSSNLTLVPNTLARSRRRVGRNVLLIPFTANFRFSHSGHS